MDRKGRGDSNRIEMGNESERREGERGNDTE